MDFGKVFANVSNRDLFLIFSDERRIKFNGFKFFPSF